MYPVRFDVKPMLMSLTLLPSSFRSSVPEIEDALLVRLYVVDLDYALPLEPEPGYEVGVVLLVPE